MAACESTIAPATLGRLADWGAARLQASSDSARLDAEILLAEVTGTARSAIFAFAERTVGADARQGYARLIERRCAGEPVAYLTGRREFYGLTLAVGRGVLVPRPETEILVDKALALLPERHAATVLDLGTGSAAIALAIKQARPDVEVTAVDASEEALGFAQRNATAHGLYIRSMQSDWFDGVEGDTFDVVVANPPYVESDDPVLRDALRHEPRAALDGGKDGLDAIRAIVAAATGYLRVDGWLLVEHGEDQGDATRKLAEQAGYRDVGTLKDLAGRDRVLSAGVP